VSLCGVRGTKVTPQFRVPPAPLVPDLDMRSDEPARFNLLDWVRVCVGRGAAASDFSAVTSAAGTIMRTDPCQSIPGSAETREFRRWAMSTSDAGATPWAAWDAEDAGHLDEAVHRYVWRLPRSVPVQATFKPRATGWMHRAAWVLFDQAAAWLMEIDTRPLDGMTASVIHLQRARIEVGDTGRYLPGAANVPHVSHGTRPGVRLLARWFGRSGFRGDLTD